MSDAPDFRSWAARVAGQATQERDDSEVLRLMSIAGYWERLADIEDWQRDGVSLDSKAKNAPASIGPKNGPQRPASSTVPSLHSNLRDAASAAGAGSAVTAAQMAASR